MKNKDNIISLLEKIKERQMILDQEYASDDYAWETQVDLCLQELSGYVEQVVECSKAMVGEIEDLNREIEDLKLTVRTILKLLYLQKVKGANDEEEH